MRRYLVWLACAAGVNGLTVPAAKRDAVGKAAERQVAAETQTTRPAFEQGFAGPRRLDESLCRDDNENCEFWALLGECEANPGYMLVSCSAACGCTEAPTATPAPTVTLVPTASPLVADNESIREAVKLWLSDRAAAMSTYGHIATWETGGVTDMSELFCARRK